MAEIIGRLLDWISSYGLFLKMKKIYKYFLFRKFILEAGLNEPDNLFYQEEII